MIHTQPNGADMQTHNTTRSPGAIALGGFLASVTGFVLFNDVLTQHAPVNTGHALSLAALVTALAAFHMAWPCAKRRAFGSAIALTLLGLGATSYIVISSGARNAETAQAKTNAARAENENRARELAAHERAEDAVTDARDKKARECATGRGPLCRAAIDSLEMAEAALAASAIAVKSLGPEIEINGGYAHAAQVLSAAGFGNSAEIESRIELLLPFIAVLVVELGTVTFLHVGLGQPIPPAPVSSVPNVEPEAEFSNEDNVVSWVREFRARNGRNPQIPELQREFQLPKTTAWRRIKSA